MPKYSHVNLLLPCHSLEDFPTHHVGEMAEGLLANWTARWHPHIIAATEAKPKWSRVDELGELEGAVVLLPAASRDELLYDYPEDGVAVLEEKCEKAGAILLTDRTDRDGLAAELVGHLAPANAPKVDDDLVRDFYALGYWHLQIELLTRQMRYASHLDDGAFSGAAVEAARMATSGDVNAEEMRRLLQICFTMLAEERNHYYPVDAYLLEMPLIAPSTKSADIRHELQQIDKSGHINLWCTGSTAKKMQDEDPELVSEIREGIQSDRVQLIGCEFSESPISLTSPEAWLADIRQGIETYQSAFGVRPTTYFRRKFGLNPALPTLLTLTGWQNVVHATLDAGQFPTLQQSRTSWAGFNIVAIHAFGNVPVDASRPETFLKLALTMGQSMERDYVAAVCLAHWCGKVSHWLEEVRRGQKYDLGIGNLSRFEDFFASTEFSSQSDSPSIDKYRSPYLIADVTAGKADPVSRHVRRWNADAIERDVSGLAAWAAVLGVDKQESETACHVGDAAELVAGKLKSADGNDDETGRLLLNLQNVPVVDDRSGMKVPACGYLWTKKTNSAGTADLNDVDGGPSTIVSDDLTMSNDFLSLKIDPVTGAIRSVYDKVTRGNRFSQRLAYVDAESASGGVTDMRCDTFKVVRNDQAAGVIRSEGRLVEVLEPGGEDSEEKVKVLAGFSQEITLRRSSRVIELEIELEPKVELSDKAWRNYFACRWAWAGSEATLFRSILGGRFETSAKRIEAPLNLEIVESRRHTTILSGGLSYHHQCDERMLDSILQVRGETTRKFRVGIGIELPNPQQASWMFAKDGGENAGERNAGGLVEIESTRPRNKSGCLFHINSPHVIATGWDPIWAQPSGNAEEECTTAGKCEGFRVRLMETSGKSGRVKLSAPRRLESAVKCDLLGSALQLAQVSDGVAEISLSANEWTAVECRW